MFIALIVSILVNLAIVGGFLWYKSQWEYTETKEITVELLNFMQLWQKPFLMIRMPNPKNYPGIRNILQVTNAIKPSLMEGFILLLGGTIYYF